MKTYKLSITPDKDLSRVMDRKGDWNFYFHSPTKRYLPAVNFILDRGFAKGPALIQWMKNNSADEIERKLKVAGDRGDAIHQFISKIFSGEAKDRLCQILAEDNKTSRVLTDDEWDAILAFQEFWNNHKPILLAYEKPIYDLKIGYAGTMDAIIKLTKQCDFKTCKCKNFLNQWGLFDWKSGSGIYPSYGPQIAAYGASQSIKAYLGKVGKVKLGYSAILRIGTNHKQGYEFVPYDKKESNLNWKKFLAALIIADFEPFDEKEIYEVPDILNIIIKQVKQVKQEQFKAPQTNAKRTKISGQSQHRAIVKPGKKN